MCRRCRRQSGRQRPLLFWRIDRHYPLFMMELFRSLAYKQKFELIQPSVLSVCVCFLERKYSSTQYDGKPNSRLFAKCRPMHQPASWNRAFYGYPSAKLVLIFFLLSLPLLKVGKYCLCPTISLLYSGCL